MVMTKRVPLAPSGWPSAIAPPLTLVLSRFRPSTFSTAKYCAANASFTSTRSIWSNVSPASFSAFCEDGTGPIPMMLGSTPGTVHDPAGVPRRHDAVFLKRQRQLLQGFHGRFRPTMIVFADDDCLFALLD